MATNIEIRRLLPDCRTCPPSRPPGQAAVKITTDRGFQRDVCGRCAPLLDARMSRLLTVSQFFAVTAAPERSVAS